MTDAEFRIWVSRVPELDQTQSAALLARLRILSDGDRGAAPGKSDFGTRVCSAICHVLNRRGADFVSPHVLQRSAAYGHAKGKFADLAKYFERVSPRRLEQDQILREGIELLYHDLLHWKVAISPHTLLQQIHRIPATLSRHYPGYAESGVLHKLIREVGNGRRIMQTFDESDGPITAYISPVPGDEP